MTLKTPDMAQWIPGPGGINLEKGIGSCTGDLLENQSILGPLLRMSFLPSNLQFVIDAKTRKTHDKLNGEFVQCKSQNAFDKVAQNMQLRQRQVTHSLVGLFKTLMKDAKHRNEILRWLAACVSSNISRTKLGHSLA